MLQWSPRLFSSTSEEGADSACEPALCCHQILDEEVWWMQDSGLGSQWLEFPFASCRSSSESLCSFSDPCLGLFSWFELRGVDKEQDEQAAHEASCADEPLSVVQADGRSLEKHPRRFGSQIRCRTRCHQEALVVQTLATACFCPNPRPWGGGQWALAGPFCWSQLLESCEGQVESSRGRDLPLDRKVLRNWLQEYPCTECWQCAGPMDIFFLNLLYVRHGVLAKHWPCLILRESKSKLFPASGVFQPWYI